MSHGKTRPLVLSLTAAFLALGLLAALVGLLSSWQMARALERDEAEKSQVAVCSELAGLSAVLVRQQQPGLVDLLDARWRLPEQRFRYRYRSADGRDAAATAGGAADIPSAVEVVGTLPVSRCFGSALEADMDEYLRSYYQPDIALGRYRDADGTAYTVASLQQAAGLGASRIDVAAPTFLPAVARARTAMRQQSLVWLSILLASSALGWGLHRVYQRRVAALNAVLERVQRGDLGARPPPSRHRDELAQLGRQIAEKLELLQHQVHAMERVSLEIAHEIARPLSSIALETYNARRAAPDAPTRERLERIHARVTSVGQAMNALMDFGQKAGLGTPGYGPFATLALDQLLADVIAGQSAECSAKGLRMRATLEPELRVYGSAPMLAVLFGNLLSNAIKFTESGDVTVLLERSERGFLLRIRDGGPGLSSTAIERLGTPFLRSSGGAQHGHGLGLTLVYTIAARHGFRVLDPVNLAPGLEVAVAGPLVAAAGTA